MGSEVFADGFSAGWMARIDAALGPFLGWSVAEVLQSAESDDLFDRTEIAQPALFAVQVAILEWLRAHGIEAEAMVGHSVGEVAAAYAAGVLPLAEACRVVAVRSRAQGRTAGAGRMAAFGVSCETATAAIAAYDDRLTVAAINSPTSVTVAGDPDALTALGADLDGSPVFFRPLALDYAFHSRTMEPIRDELFDRLEGLTPQVGHRRFVSSVTGAAEPNDPPDSECLWEKICGPLLFAPPLGGPAAEGLKRVFA